MKVIDLQALPPNLAKAFAEIKASYAKEVMDEKLYQEMSPRLSKETKQQLMDGDEWTKS